MRSKVLQREYRIIQEMITLSCRKRHTMKSRELCRSCIELLAYAHARLAKCPYQEQNRPVPDALSIVTKQLCETRSLM